jgi:phosphoribosyl 1,2-cyclic phosphate phosphodiesterase
MEILFCGTAAAEGWPALFCTCAACTKAREIGGKELRSRAAYMIDDRIRVDFGPDSNLHQQKYGLAYDKLEHLIVTHSHDDHWFVQDIGYRRKGFSVVPEAPLHVWGNEKVEQKFVKVNGPDWQRFNIVFHRLTAFQPVDLSNGVSATPILAAHDRSEECFNYLIEAKGRRTLLGHDTGWYGEETWSHLTGKPVNLLVLDCTHGTEDHEPNHLGGTVLARVRDELARRGSLAADAVCIATHFSHNGGSLHTDLEAFFTPLGFGVAYDGLKIVP